MTEAKLETVHCVKGTAIKRVAMDPAWGPSIIANEIRVTTSPQNFLERIFTLTVNYSAGPSH